MNETINNINKKILELSKSIVLAGNLIRINYEETNLDRKQLIRDAEKEAEFIIKKELKKITKYSVKHDDFEEFNTPEYWLIEGVNNWNAFIDKKGKFYFRIVLTTPVNEYDEIINKHIFVMDYFPIQDEIYYTLEGLGRFKIEKASARMKKIKRL